MSAQTYKGCIVETLSSKGVTQPDVVLEIIHVQHQTPNTILQHRKPLLNSLIIEKQLLFQQNI